MPGLRETLDANLQVARLTNPDVRAVGVALNTSKLSPAEAERLCAETADALGLPCTDPFSMGDPIIDWIVKCFEPSPRKATRSEERRVGKRVSVRVDLGGRRIMKKKNKKN